MKRAGWLGIVLIAVGALMIWAGFNGVRLTDVIGSVLRNEPLPAPEMPALEPTPGGSGESGLEDGADPEAGDGAGGGGGGGW